MSIYKSRNVKNQKNHTKRTMWQNDLVHLDSSKNPKGTVNLS